MVGPIAQRLEQSAHNREVPGSNPGGPTNLLPDVGINVILIIRAMVGAITFLKDLKLIFALSPKLVVADDIEGFE